MLNNRTTDTREGHAPAQVLTIVVPAWKPAFLPAALQSIADQTDKRFSVIVVDDAGPASIREIVQRYPGFGYVRFEHNLGGNNLVAHWNRCLHLVDTPWVWLFSDDDVMSKTCVAAFHAGRARHAGARLFQFSVKQVDETLVPLYNSPATAHQSIQEFIAARFRSAKISCVPDHVFNWTELRQLQHGFVDFPLAWNADDATWIALAGESGIHGLPDGEVLWRQSAQNISNSHEHAFAKLQADILYLNWLRRHGHLASYVSTARWLGARIGCAYGFKRTDCMRVYRVLPAWLKPAGFLSLAYPFLRSIKTAFRKQAMQ